MIADVKEAVNPRRLQVMAARRIDTAVVAP
jgi:hypothetical protein